MAREADESPTDVLLELSRSGQLAARYPEVSTLTAGLTGDALARAGRLLAALDPDEVLRAHPRTPALTVALTGHGTLSPLVPPLTAELARHGIVMRRFVGTFDSFVFDLGDPGSDLYTARPDLVLLVLDPMMVFDEVPVPWQPDDVQRVLADKLTLVRRLVEQFQATAGRATLVLNTVPLPTRFTAQLVDYRSRAQLGVAWREANAELLRLCGTTRGVVVVDLGPLVCEGIPASDTRLSVYAKAHLSTELLARYAREIGHLARGLVGRTRKALALDLDGTLWGGVLGDDGVDGIEVDGSYRGEAFRAFQRVLKQLGSQGVLLAAVSKNDVEAVCTALRDKAGMVLREADFVRVVANWRPKHDNLVELAAALNLGLDSIVFVDDSRFECGLVRQELPQVAVVPVDGEPALHVQKLLRDGWFDVREVTAEDRTRVELYQQEQARNAFLDRFTSVEEYLRELSVSVRLGPAEEADVPRISQLTLRTNQFNLTTRRLQPEEVRAALAEPGVRVFTIRSGDRFGDNGLVGVVFTRRVDDLVSIDNFLLSCRVFSRGIEQACLGAVLRQAERAGARAVVGHYRPSAKNGMVRDLYPRYGFTPVPSEGRDDEGGADDDSGAVAFRHDLTAVVTTPEHIQLTEIEQLPAPGSRPVQTVA
jgi:FkbH-like protein